MNKRRILVCTLLLSLLIAPAALSEGPFEMMGLELEASRDWATSRFFTRMQEETGVSFTFRQYGDRAAYQQAKEDAFAPGGDLPDVLFKAVLRPEEEMVWHQSGQLVDLAPYLQTHMPNLSRILNAREDWRSAITQPDGAITSLPILSGADRECIVWINHEWLDAVGLDMPTTIEAYTDALRAFKTGDPNGNGSADEVPLLITGPWEAKFLLHAWGLAPNDYNLYIGENGTARFAPLEEGFRAFVQWLRDAQAEGLIDADAFRTTHAARSSLSGNTEDTAPATSGSVIAFAPYAESTIGLARTSAYAAMPPLLHEGSQVYRRLLPGVTRGAFAVTSACEDIPAVLRWADYLYTEEGGRLAFAGTEGVDYAIKPDGTWAWSAGEDYMALTALVNEAVIAGDSNTPGLEPAAFMRSTEIAADNYTRRQTDAIRDLFTDPFPITWPTDGAREARIAELQAIIAPRVDAMIGSAALGKVELTEAAWAAFEADLQALGLDEFLSLWQAKYDESK